MSETVVVGIVVGTTSLLSAALGTFGAIYLEDRRVRAAREDSVQQRKLDVLVSFNATATEWLARFQSRINRERALATPDLGALKEAAADFREASATLQLLGGEAAVRWYEGEFYPLYLELATVAEARPRNYDDDYARD